MKIIKPSVEIIIQQPGYDGMIRHIEKCGRTCYKSNDLITEDSAEGFVNMLKKSGHLSVLEHGAVYLQMPYSQIAFMAFEKNPYSKVTEIKEAGCLFVSTNYRVIVENKLEDLLKYIVEPGPMHEPRITARFQCQIAISREYNRHRVNSIAEQSTRYCNFSKDKYGNEISINLPTWIEEDGIKESRAWTECQLDNKSLLLLYCTDIANDDDEEIFSSIDYWLFANLVCEYSYMKLIEKGWKAQQARTVLPLDTNTGLVHTAFLSDWQHFFQLRCDKAHAHPDAYYLASELQKQFIQNGYAKCD